ITLSHFYSSSKIAKNRARLPRDQLARKIQFGYLPMYTIIKPNLVEGISLGKRSTVRQSDEQKSDYPKCLYPLLKSDDS
ncbi:hypothetical protein, partial [Staphylococcus delphini]|uniref:hypothetical protein n=1 Tax=Staphylococcus delphini TaxID=53344 RepID=UPI001F38CD1E